MSPLNVSALDEARTLSRLNERVENQDTSRLGERLLEETLAQYHAHHSAEIKQLRKSNQLTAYIVHYTSDRVFTGGTLLVERLEVCVEILAGCAQRPVLELIGLVLLELDFMHAWTTSHPFILERILTLDATQSRHHTIPMLALCMHHSESFATRFAERISDSNLNAKRTRVGELIETVDVFPLHEPIAPFIDLAYGAIFERTSYSDKVQLLRRVIKECLNKKMFLRHERWVLLIDPIITQNLQSEASLDMLSDLMEVLPEREATRYLANYTIATAQNRRMLHPNMLDMIEAHATSDLIPYLYPSTLHTERTLFSQKKTDYAIRVEHIIETVIAREKLNRNTGGLSLSEGGPSGGLTVLNASHGALSIDAHITPHVAEPHELMPPIHDALSSPLAKPQPIQLNMVRVYMVIAFIIMIILMFVYV